MKNSDNKQSCPKTTFNISSGGVITVEPSELIKSDGVQETIEYIKKNIDTIITKPRG